MSGDARKKGLDYYEKFSLRDLVMMALDDEAREPSTFREVIIRKMDEAGLEMTPLEELDNVKIEFNRKKAGELVDKES